MATVDHFDTGFLIARFQTSTKGLRGSRLQLLGQRAGRRLGPRLGERPRRCERPDAAAGGRPRDLKGEGATWVGGLGRLVGWWVGGLVGWWVGGLVGWWVGWLVGWWVGVGGLAVVVVLWCILLGC